MRGLFAVFFSTRFDYFVLLSSFVFFLRPSVVACVDTPFFPCARVGMWLMAVSHDFRWGWVTRCSRGHFSRHITGPQDRVPLFDDQLKLWFVTEHVVVVFLCVSHVYGFDRPIPVGRGLWSGAGVIAPLPASLERTSLTRKLCALLESFWNCVAAVTGKFAFSNMLSIDSYRLIISCRWLDSCLCVSYFVSYAQCVSAHVWYSGVNCCLSVWDIILVVVVPTLYQCVKRLCDRMSHCYSFVC